MKNMRRGSGLASRVGSCVLPSTLALDNQLRLGLAIVIPRMLSNRKADYARARPSITAEVAARLTGRISIMD